jgi:hypothetical protein
MADDLGLTGHWDRDSEMAAPDYTPMLAEAV